MAHELPSIEQATKYAEAFYSGVQVVAEYMKARSLTIQAIHPKQDTKHHDEALQGLLLRCLSWVLTLEQLNHAKYFQAIVTANRALLEMVVDTILLHTEKSNLSGWKFHSWAESEKLKAASATVRFFDDSGEALPDEYRPLEEFLNTQRAMIEKRRIDLWGKTSHPRRWTGRNNLFDDIVKADRIFGKEIVGDLRSSLTRYYRTEYPRMNWQIHSGSAAFGNLPPQSFGILCAMAFNWNADLAMFATKVVLVDFGLLGVFPELIEDWENVKRQRLKWYAEKMYSQSQPNESKVCCHYNS